MKLDTLVIAAHPDDAELSCSGTLIKMVQEGKKVGIADLTRGEMGTRGTPEIRLQEAEEAGRIMGLAVRGNLGLQDAFFTNDKAHQLEVIRVIRKYQPELLILNAVTDRHPDHGKGYELVKQAAFMSGLKMIATTDHTGKPQEAWRPGRMFSMIQSQNLAPDIIVDVSGQWTKKMDAIRAYKSQFYDPANEEPDTYISSPEFMKMIEARGKEMGHAILKDYGEGFNVVRTMGVNSLFDLL